MMIYSQNVSDEEKLLLHRLIGKALSNIFSEQLVIWLNKSLIELDNRIYFATDKHEEIVIMQVYFDETATGEDINEVHFTTVNSKSIGHLKNSISFEESFIINSIECYGYNFISTSKMNKVTELIIDETFFLFRTLKPEKAFLIFPQGPHPNIIFTSDQNFITAKLKQSNLSLKFKLS